MSKIILSTHAKERLKKRRLSLWSLEDTITNPTKKISLGEGKCKYIKKQGSRLYQVVATYLPAEKAYLVISAWVRGEDDRSPLIWRLLVGLLKTIFLPLTFTWRRYSKRPHC